MAASTDHGTSEQPSRPRWTGAPAGYLPIAEHGIIGDLHTAALVGSDGTIVLVLPGSVRRAECLRSPAGS